MVVAVDVVGSLKSVTPLIVMLTVDRPHAWLMYGVVATLGSWAGCMALYYVARQGGDEFIVLLSETGEPGAIEVSTRMKEAVAACRLPCGGMYTHQPAASSTRSTSPPACPACS